MTTYLRCRDCGNDLTSQEEQELVLCWECQKAYPEIEIKEEVNGKSQ